jgi:dsDNA-binding SOS-regulon protein
MKKVRYSEFLKKRELEDVLIEKAIADVEELEAYLEKSSVSLDDCSAEDLKLFIGLLIKDKKNSLERLVNLARYFYVVQRIDLYRYFLGILGGDGVINSIARRTTQFTDAETKEHIFSGIVFPPLGSPIEDYPIVMQKFVKRMQALLPNGLLKKILA